jgi:biopolymer transport protein ExbB/TolQ
MEHLEGWVLAGVAILGMFGTIGLQWVLYDRRLTKIENDGTADHALQTAAEVENRHNELEEMIDNFSRDGGETARAMQHKIKEVELWVRDHLVRKDSFKEVTDRIEKLAENRDARLERQLDAIFKRLDILAQMSREG